jgi:hypothetical protein
LTGIGGSAFSEQFRPFEHRGRQVECVYGLCLYISGAQRVQQGEGCCPKTGASIQNPKLRF